MMNAITTPTPARSTPAKRSELPRLLAALKRRAIQNGHTMVELAQQLGVTTGYLQQLRSGTRDTAAISLDFARACSRYLNTSTLVVLILAGKLDAHDLTLPPGYARERRLREGLNALLNDELYAGFVPESALRSLPTEVQSLLVALYEEATQQEFAASPTRSSALQGALRLAVVLAEDEAEGRVPVEQEEGDNDVV